MKRKIIILIFIFLLGNLFSAQDELFITRGKAGSAACFLNSFFESYGVSTAGAIVSTGDTIETIFWNPALLSLLTGTRFLIGGSILPADRYFSYISLAYPFGENNDKGFGITLLNSYSGDIISYDENVGDNLNYIGNSLIISYARPFDIIKAGINFKLANEMIQKNYSYGLSFDLGLTVTPPLPIQLGIALKNFPGLSKWQGQKKVDLIENQVLISVGYKSFSKSTKVGLTFLKESNDDEIYVNLGAEIALASFMDVRFGFFKGNFSGGIGLNFSFMRINYAFYNDSFLDLGEYSHLISTVLLF
jgi:hypothetical protein